MTEENGFKTLSECQENECVKIVHINDSGSLKTRLLEMGFVRGAKIDIIKYAPLHDPMELVVGSTHTSVRVSEATSIIVSPLNNEDKLS